MSRLFHYLLFSFLATASSMAHAQSFDMAPPAWIQEKPVIPPPLVSPLPGWYEVRDGDWTLAPEVLGELAALIEAKLAHNASFSKANPQAIHAIQFRGETVDGVKIVRMLGQCHVSPDTLRQMSVTFMQIRDGGRCVFEAEYLPSEKRISYFRYNGYALGGHPQRIQHA